MAIPVLARFPALAIPILLNCLFALSVQTSLIFTSFHNNCLQSLIIIKNVLIQMIHFQQTMHTPFRILCVKCVIDIIKLLIGK